MAASLGNGANGRQPDRKEACTVSFHLCKLPKRQTHVQGQRSRAVVAWGWGIQGEGGGGGHVRAGGNFGHDGYVPYPDGSDGFTGMSACHSV